MGEKFFGTNRWVAMSNGAAKELMCAWVTLGERMPADDDLDHVLAFLRQRAVGEEIGWRSFNFNPPPAELDHPKRLVALARLVRAFAVELAGEEPDPTLTKICWDRELRMIWLARMLDFDEIICETGQLQLSPVESSDLSLNTEDQLRCTANRLANRMTYQSSVKGLSNELMTTSDELLRVLLQMSASTERDLEVSREYWERANHLSDAERYADAVEELQRAIAIEPDPEQVRAIEEFTQTCLDLEHS